MEAAAGMVGVKWIRGDIKYWIHIYTLHDHDEAFHRYATSLYCKQQNKKVTAEELSKETYNSFTVYSRI